MRRAVVAVIQRPDRRILMVERPAHDSHPGTWNPVTGAEEEVDGGDLMATCRREVLEEVGLEVRVIGKLWESVTLSGHFSLHWYLVLPLGDGDPTPDPNEVAAWRWVAPDAMRELPKCFADTHHFFERIFAAAAAEAQARFAEEP